MEIKVAKSSGFCFGVSRAVKAVYDCIEAHPGKKIYTYGPIVHNAQVVGELKGLGVEPIESGKELTRLFEEGSLDGAFVVIRAHGISDMEMKKLKEIPGLTVVDATCPNVTKIHEIAKNASGNGYEIVIAGDPEHPEIKGIVGSVQGPVTVIRNAEEARNFRRPQDAKIRMVSQTTFNPRKFEEIVEIFKNKMYDVSIVNTICNATQRRQSEAAELSRECDVMFVIGGKDSSNTAKLYEICRSECQATYYIQCLDDLSRVAIGNSVRCIGITAGASTPKTIIEEVLNYVRTEFWRYAR